jgi:hypothetical protein
MMQELGAQAKIIVPGPKKATQSKQFVIPCVCHGDPLGSQASSPIQLFLIRALLQASTVSRKPEIYPRGRIQSEGEFYRRGNTHASR